MKILSIIIISLLVLASCRQEETLTTNTGTTVEVPETTISPDEELEKNDEEEVLVSEIEPYKFFTPNDELVNIYPIDHASLVIEWGEQMLYIDPVQDMVTYEQFGNPSMIFVTHIHPDHFNEEILGQLSGENIPIIMPSSVQDALTTTSVRNVEILNNGEAREIGEFAIAAIPAYNLRSEALQYHPKERGDNGYIISKDDFTIYVAGDTEDIPEMRRLSGIDVAFIPMNLPYTMTVNSAASAVLDFAPKTVFPYHYRGEDGLSDLELFESEVVLQNPEIEVVLHDWYK